MLCCEIVESRWLSKQDVKKESIKKQHAIVEGEKSQESHPYTRNYRRLRTVEKGTAIFSQG